MKTIYLIIAITLFSSCLTSTNLGGGIHDYVMALPRVELEQWGLAAELYHAEVYNSTVIQGGMHDYVHLISGNSIIKYILSEANELPELNSVEKFKNLTARFMLGTKKRATFSKLYEYDREQLIKWALQCEGYHYRNQTVLGGIHDRIRTITVKELVEYIQHILDLHKEFGLMEYFRLKYLEDTPTLGGLHDFIFRLPREKIFNWALACEAYDRKIRNVHLKGGLHDYIDILSDEQIAEYVLAMAKKYPELDSMQKLDEITTKNQSSKPLKEGK